VGHPSRGVLKVPRLWAPLPVYVFYVHSCFSAQLEFWLRGDAFLWMGVIPSRQSF
jgi:hypothetical protein